MEITTLEIAGLSPALHGMRNPMNSWEKSDSKWCSTKVGCEGCPLVGVSDCSSLGYDPLIIGEADMKLAQNLSKAGAEHRKYLRMIQVWADFDMPRYWWSEFDTYHFNTKNSCSTMHKITENRFTIEDFHFPVDSRVNSRTLCLMHCVITELNVLREEYLETKDFQRVMEMKRILPESYLQKRTVNTNYEEVANMYHQRKHHRQKDEWVDTFCKWAESLPYFKELCVRD